MFVEALKGFGASFSWFLDGFVEEVLRFERRLWELFLKGVNDDCVRFYQFQGWFVAVSRLSRGLGGSFERFWSGSSEDSGGRH